MAAAVAIVSHGCSATCDSELQGRGSPRARPIETAPPTSASLRSNKKVIALQINGEPERRWTVAPELSPDTLRVECSDQAATKVRFTSDVDEKIFTVSGDEHLQFEVILSDGTKALTEIECIPLRIRYRGDYGAGKPSPDNFAADLSAGILERHLQEMVEKRKIPGLAVVVVQDQKIIFQKSYGVSDRKTRRPFTGETPVRLASATKVLTGLLMLSLAEDGVIDLESPIETYLAKAPAAWRGIPVWRMLNHTTGIPRLLSQPGFGKLSKQEQAAFTYRQVFDRIKDLPLDFQPGSDMRYQQSAYSVLAMFTTETTGKSWDELLELHVFGPANMTSTRYGDSLGDHPPGYVLDNGALRKEDYYYPRALSMGGGYNSSANDIARLFKSFRAGAIVSMDYLKSQVFRDERIADGRDRYGIATIVKEFENGATIGHSGGGGLADIRYAPDAKVGIAVFSNRSGSDIAYDITDEISELLLGKKKTKAGAE